MFGVFYFLPWYGMLFIPMQLKTNLHFHSGDDPVDSITYSLYEGIDHAAALGFEVLASTPHTRCLATSEHVAYAAEKDILLIPGIEADIYDGASTKRNHVLILNCDRSADTVRSFEDLARYKHEHPESFIIAPHPYFYGTFSLGTLLDQHLTLFDAIELSWFYTRWFDRNADAALLALLHDLPYIATSDTHFFNFMNTNYATLDVEQKTTEQVFQALREHRFENTTSPRSLMDIGGTFVYQEIRMELRKLFRHMRAPTPSPVFQPVPALEEATVPVSPQHTPDR
jgi:predicted metal-dependent phosphoesterase TrpH